jgi:DNA (cytosine-5)-methyltransferase 1
VKVLKEFSYIDLFSGPGGLCTGFKSAGLMPLIAVELSDNTVLTYSSSHDAEVYELETLLQNIGNLESILENTTKTCLIHGDINEVSNELIKEILKKKFNRDSVDVVAGGPPCESFSMAGKRLEVDDRNDLFSNLLRIGHTANSKFVFFENVPGLLTKKRDGDSEGQFSHIIKQFGERSEDSGNHYILASDKVEIVKCLAADYGVPQKRERIFLVGCNSKYGYNPFEYPEKTHGIGRKYQHVTVGEALAYLPVIDSGQGDDLLEYKCNYIDDYKNSNISESMFEFMKFIHGDGYYLPDHLQYKSEKVTSHKAVNHRANMLERFNYIEQGEGMKKAAERLISEGREEIVKSVFPNKLYAARNRRLKSDEPCFTVTSHCLDEMIHPTLNRQLTPREVARLQSFPDWYIIEGPYVKFHSDPEQDKYEQIGDAIPVLLTKALGESLHKALIKLQN